MAGFSEIIGNDKIKEHLQSSIQAGRVAQAYILSSDDIYSRAQFAEAFAQTLQCEAHGIEPCGHCMSCMQAASSNHPDIIHVTKEKAQYGVDEIRYQVNSDILIKPYSGSYKVYILDEAEKLNEQSQNALLKTIEEPPAYGVILLLTNNASSLLPTILSRCVLLNLKPVSKELIKNYLMEKKEIPDYLASISASFSGGNVGKAIQYASSEDFIGMKEDVLQLVKYIDDMGTSEIMDALTLFTTRKNNIDDYLDLISLWFRDILVYKATKDANQLLFREEFSEIKRQAGIRSFENLNNISIAFDKARMRLKAYVNFEIAMELLLLTIKEH